MTNTVNLIQLGALYYPIMLAQSEGHISEAKACELLGMKVEQYRKVKAKAVGAVISLLESLPSPLILLLDGMKAKPPS